MSSFRKKIRAAIADEALQAALDKNAAQRLAARESAFKGLSEDFQSLQRQTHALRRDAITSLERYLDQFIHQAGSNGFHIHQAANAAEARKIVLDIVEAEHASLVAKSKTMMSEEIHLNPALEQAGVRVVETDLGEYIVQLREEPPSHIITPAVHLRREDVGETFHQKLGIPYTHDIPTLTNTARARLRDVFLEADIGISGVNVGVADQGWICVVTNEGNGRMVTTLPRVHIALMGIERLVPDLDGLAQIIKMLPRAATGQRISVYTQLIRSPRQPGEFDGAQERHIVLIDNGRRQLLGTPLEEVLYCIRCGSCINACPVFREIGGFSYTSMSGDYTPYPGPIGSALSPGLFGQADFGHLAQASTLCGACKEACPVDIDLPTMLLRVRAGGTELEARERDKRTPEGMPVLIAWGLRAFTWAATHPALFNAAQRFAALAGKIWSPRRDLMHLPSFTGWGFSKDLPRPDGRTFHRLWETRREALGGKGSIVQGALETASTQPDAKPIIKYEPTNLVTLFEAELTSLSGYFIPSEPQDLASKILGILKEKEIKTILAWDASVLPEGLLSNLEQSGIRIDFGADPEIKAGLSGVNAAVAETGTLVLASGAGCPGATTLLPEIHLAVLHEVDIYENLPQVLRLQEIQAASTVVLISGPSRTADLEMTLTIGVHGPGELYVFCLKDQARTR